MRKFIQAKQRGYRRSRAERAWRGRGGRRGASAAEPRGEGMAGERRERGQQQRGHGGEGSSAHTQRRAAERRGARAQGRETASPMVLRVKERGICPLRRSGHGLSPGCRENAPGSRHFRRHRGFIPEGSLFVSLRATGYLLSPAA